MTKYLNMTALTLVIIGSLNWGIFGLFGINLVAVLFGNALLARVIYILVGISALYSITFYKKSCRTVDPNVPTS